jgi:hypothetical protein
MLHILERITDHVCEDTEFVWDFLEEEFYYISEFIKTDLHSYF